MTKIRNDYIEFIKKGVLNGSIKCVLPDSGASSSTGESKKDYIETGQKLSKEFQSAFGEAKKQQILSNIHSNYARKLEGWISFQISKVI